MQHEVSTHKLRRNKSTTGFSFIELLLAMFISSVMLVVMTGFVQKNIGTRFDMGLQTEAAQGIQALQSMVSQEVRQAGACLPTAGPFIALAGVDSGTLDTLTARIGKTSATTGRCINPNLTEVDAAQGATTVQLLNTGDFAVGGRVYVTNLINGDLNTVVSKTATTLSLAVPLSVSYPKNSSTVYAIDERTYKVMTGPLGHLALHVSIDNGTFQPLVDGVQQFRVQYLEGPCTPTCSVLDFPASTADWYKVAEISLTTKVTGHKDQTRSGQPVTETGQITIKPRNLYLQ